MATPRLDFSAQTLDNWAAKVGNMLLEELDLDTDSTITIDLPVSWQAASVDTPFGQQARGMIDFGPTVRFYGD